MLVLLVNQELDIFKTFVTSVFKAVNVIPDFLLPWAITTSLVSILITHWCETSFVKERRFIPGCSNHDWLLCSNFYKRWCTRKTRLQRSIDLIILPIPFVSRIKNIWRLVVLKIPFKEISSIVSSVEKRSLIRKVDSPGERNATMISIDLMECKFHVSTGCEVTSFVYKE